MTSAKETETASFLPSLPNQPGETQSRMARHAAAGVRDALKGLTPWAKLQVLDAVRQEISDAKHA